MILRRPYQRPEPVGVLLGVVVEECHVLRVGHPDPGVDRGGDAPVLAERDHLYPGEVFLYKTSRAVRGAVIHQNRLEISERLLLQRTQAEPQEPFAVPVRDDDRDAGRHGFRLACLAPLAWSRDRGPRRLRAAAPTP